MPRFYPLEVTAIRRDTRNAVVVTLVPREQDRARFDFIQGQYLTFRRRFDGVELRRCYSICAGRDDGHLRVGIKRVDGGCFSTWANTELEAGAVLEAMPPDGNFHTPLDPGAAGYYLGIAAGSGITPVLGIIRTVLVREPKSRFTLVYGNRSISSIMFREELEDLKNAYMGRFNVIHVLAREAQEIELFSGRIDSEKCAALFRGWIDIAAVTTAFVCGPEPMMMAVSGALKTHGLADSRIRFELFTSAGSGRAPLRAGPGASGATAVSRVNVTLDGVTHEIEVGNETVLDAALGASLDAPHACKAGVCSSCRAMVLEGEVEMRVNHALEDHEVREGYVLTCQGLVLSETAAVSYDLR